MYTNKERIKSVGLKLIISVKQDNEFEWSKIYQPLPLCIGMMESQVM